MVCDTSWRGFYKSGHSRWRPRGNLALQECCLSDMLGKSFIVPNFSPEILPPISWRISRKTSERLWLNGPEHFRELSENIFTEFSLFVLPV